ncbi:hypothetical protein K7W42_20285 [Deinococcus sp. HMF7604]|uniref:hypothetical protein n=1 Tax=Deinococcus betulae TaxID=2873312 RepID=UPI001CCA0F59|nr:hypothetical protein [Deinococcus betulae]MBZ9753178.1 hypothetical protein [Deinococcus betulae]
MNPVQEFIDLLQTTLEAALPSYTVEAREPAEGELVATDEVKQIFITTEGFDFAEGIADFGQTTRVVVPVMVGCVMQRPGKVTLAAKVLRRRLTLVQAVQRAVQDFGPVRPDVMAVPLSEQPLLIEGYLVSMTGVELTFDLDAEEGL